MNNLLRIQLVMPFIMTIAQIIVLKKMFDHLSGDCFGFKVHKFTVLGHS